MKQLIFICALLMPLLTVQPVCAEIQSGYTTIGSNESHTIPVSEIYAPFSGQRAPSSLLGETSGGSTGETGSERPGTETGNKDNPGVNTPIGSPLLPLLLLTIGYTAFCLVRRKKA